MFARRGFNIDSLAVGPTERPASRASRCASTAEHHSLEQIEKQIHKLVNVLRVTELAPDEAVERELLLLKVSADPERRAELISTAEAFKGRVVDLGPDSVTFELTGHARGARRVPGARPAARHPGARPHRPRRHGAGLRERKATRLSAIN